MICAIAPNPLPLWRQKGSDGGADVLGSLSVRTTQGSCHGHGAAHCAAGVDRIELGLWQQLFQ